MGMINIMSIGEEAGVIKMSRKRILEGLFSTREKASKVGQGKVYGSGRTDKLFSPYKKYEVVKAPSGMWKLYLVEKTMYEKLHGKAYRR